MNIKSLVSKKPIIIAFRILVASLRGTEVAIYDYASANEEILGNKSIILIKEVNVLENEFVEYHNQEIINKFKERFLIFFYKL